MSGHETQTERCGTWMDADGYSTICMEPIDHEGQCRPSLSDLLREIDRCSRQAAALAEYVRKQLDV